MRRTMKPTQVRSLLLRTVGTSHRGVLVVPKESQNSLNQLHTRVGGDRTVNLRRCSHRCQFVLADTCVECIDFALPL